MSETLKTLTFAGLAIVIFALAWFVNYKPASTTDPQNLAGTALFPDFTDTTAVASLEIVKYDDQTNDFSNFLVKQVNNRWSIPSHENYPTDARDQLTEAAASVFGLDILSVVSSEIGDHAEYGVIDPDPKTVTSATKGVGTKVTLKNAKGETLIGLIIGKTVKDQPSLRYVRRAGQTPVYITSVKTDKLSTQFGDWIEKDLLKLNVWDIKQLTINDYSIDILNGTVNIKGRMKIDHHDGQTPAWSFVEDVVDDGKQLSDVPLAEDEELNEEKLTALASALDEMKIVDVRRKPEGMSASLQATGEWTKSKETVQSLAEKGFYVAPFGPKGEPTLLSNEGEISVEAGQGVTYLLRFGGLATDSKGGDQTTGSANRYVFITVKFNNAAIPLPVMADLPAEPSADSPDAAKAEEINAQIEQVKQENQAKQEEYDAAVKAAEDRVAELNKRFADWYYIIDDAEYRKIHLTHKDLIRKKGAAEEGAPAGGMPGTGMPGMGAGIPGVSDIPDSFKNILPGANIPAVTGHDPGCTDPNCTDPNHVDKNAPEPELELGVGEDIVTEPIEEVAPAVPAVETPAAETPAAETPAAETPAAETPAVEIPAAETPAAETPAAETPAEPAPATVVTDEEYNSPIIDSPAPADEQAGQQPSAEPVPAETPSAEPVPAEQPSTEPAPAAAPVAEPVAEPAPAENGVAQ